MTRAKFVQKYLTPSTASTVATKRPTEQEVRNARPDGRVAYNVDLSTTKE